MSELVDRWCAAGERGDAVAAAGCLAPDVELISPLTERFRFVGAQQVEVLLAEAFTVIDDLAFHTRVQDATTAALFYRGRMGEQSLEEAQLLRLDASGRIREITLFCRPLPALTTLMARLGPALARQQGRRGLATGLSLATGPLDVMARFGERRIVPRAAPRGGTV